ncbi:hypothetical protein MMC15_003419 [Xylographa vitiligo]|nr:hypothetical protein [Xylographa vitiligo]
MTTEAMLQEEMRWKWDFRFSEDERDARRRKALEVETNVMPLVLKAQSSAPQWACPKARYAEHGQDDEAIDIEPSKEDAAEDRTPGDVSDEMRIEKALYSPGVGRVLDLAAGLRWVALREVRMTEGKGQVPTADAPLATVPEYMKNLCDITEFKDLARTIVVLGASTQGFDMLLSTWELELKVA